MIKDHNEKYVREQAFLTLIKNKRAESDTVCKNIKYYQQETK